MKTDPTDDARQFRGISLRLAPDEEARLARLASVLRVSRAKLARMALALGLVEIEMGGRR